MAQAAHPRNLRIAVVYEDHSAYQALGYSETDCARLELGECGENIAHTLETLGYEVIHIPSIRALVKRLADGEGESWDLVWNTAEGLHGMAREGQVPALLEAYRIPFTFSAAATLALCLDKAKTKMVLEHYGVPTSPFTVLHVGHKDVQLTPEWIQEFLDSSKHADALTYPLFVKPVAEGSSSGIIGGNKVLNAVELCNTVRKLDARSPTSPDLIIEKYLPGREFTVAVMGTGDDAFVLGTNEFVWDGNDKVEKIMNPYDNSWDTLVPFLTRHAKISAGVVGGKGCDQVQPNDDDTEALEACAVALQAWKALECRDCGRVDIRMDARSEHPIANVMEINPIAGLDPGHSELPIIAKRRGLSYEGLIELITKCALERSQNSVEDHKN